MNIELINNQDKIKIDLKHLEKAVSHISDKFDPGKDKTLNVVFLSDEGIKELNKNYRNIDSTTDVLSFSYIKDSISIEQDKSNTIIGEVYISPLTAQKNSRTQENGWDLELEIMLLIIHGILHIYGYDHEEEEDKAAMYSIQDSMVQDIRNRYWN